MKKVLIAIGFALFYAYDVWEAVSTLIGLPQFYEALGLGPASVPWWLLIAGIAIPPVVFVLAVLLGRKRRLAQFTFILLVGLAVVAALSLGAVAVEYWLRPVLAL